MALESIITVCLAIGTAADETSDTGSEAGDVDNTVDKDGIPRTTTISSKLNIVTTKVTLAAIMCMYSVLFTY